MAICTRRVTQGQIISGAACGGDGGDPTGSVALQGGLTPQSARTSGPGHDDSGNDADPK